MQTIHRINTRLDEVQAMAPPVLAAWMKFNRAIAGRASNLVTNAVSGASNSARKIGATAKTSAKTVGKTVEASATKVARKAEKEIVDVTDDTTARIQASNAAATDVHLSQMTKDSLYERAQLLDIDGRSQMTKRQLIEEIMATAGSAKLAQ